MRLDPYRRVLALPGVARLLVAAVLVRIPLTASGVILTLHVVTSMGRGYAAAGLVTGVATVAMGIGGPWRGRAVDRMGLRRSLVPSVVVATAAWGLAPFASYQQLLVLAAVGGLLGLPVFTVVRQSLSVLVPPAQRRTAFSLDGIGTELSFMVGPALGVLVATRLSSGAALLGLTLATLLAGLTLIVLNPPTRSATSSSEVAEVPADVPAEVSAAGGRWFTPTLAAVFAVSVGATIVLAGTDVAVVAHLREHGAVQLTGLVFVAWGIGSMVGGVVYGTVRRQLSPFAMLLVLAVLTIPVGLAPSPLLLLVTILPAAALCAPLIAATAEGVSRLVPESARGEAMGWHGSAMQAGSALGAPLAGISMDHSGAWAGFAAVGVAGAVVAATGLVVDRRRRAVPSGSGAELPAARAGRQSVTR